MELDAFTLAYIEAALWSTNDESDESGGEPMDANYSIDDIAPAALEKIIADCKEFQEKYGHLITDDNCTYKRCSVEKYAGHDFWLNRQGHGCGFWDGDWESPAAEELDAASKKAGEVYPYVGDDGKIYGFGE